METTTKSFVGSVVESPKEFRFSTRKLAPVLSPERKRLTMDLTRDFTTDLVSKSMGNTTNWKAMVNRSKSVMRSSV